MTILSSFNISISNKLSRFCPTFWTEQYLIFHLRIHLQVSGLFYLIITWKGKFKIEENIQREPVYTCYQGKNADLIKHVSSLYFSDEMKIADVTWGKGAFWKKTDTSIYDFYPSDLKTGVDFRSLPYEDESFDVLVLDPPYAHNPGKMFVDATYNNAATTSGMYHKDIIELYSKGMIEAYRVLKSKGLLLVKCQDEIESAKQKWSHIEIYNIALKLGYYAKDLFVLHQDTKPYIQHKNQKHARKNHSYLWAFIKSN
jgi:16S rRNA G966 N2-methylase RsmD